MPTDAEVDRAEVPLDRLAAVVLQSEAQGSEIAYTRKNKRNATEAKSVKQRRPPWLDQVGRFSEAMTEFATRLTRQSMMCRAYMFPISLSRGIISGAMVFCLTQVFGVTGDTGRAVAPLILSGRQTARPAGTFSPGIADVIAMLDAKVEASVISTYIQNSSVAYSPDATELLALREHGASTEVLEGLLHHGDELRLRLAQSQNTPSSQPASLFEDVTSPEQALPPYAEASPVPVEGTYSTSYYAVAYRWPWLYRTPVWNAYYPYRYAHGCWYAHQSESHVAGRGKGWTPAASARPSVSPRSAGHAGGSAIRSEVGRSVSRSR